MRKKYDTTNVKRGIDHPSYNMYKKRNDMVISLYKQKKSQTEVAKVAGICRERVRQIIKKYGDKETEKIRTMYHLGEIRYWGEKCIDCEVIFDSNTKRYAGYCRRCDYKRKNPAGYLKRLQYPDKCLDCGISIPFGTRRYKGRCPTHYHKYIFKNNPKHAEKQREWQKNNKEKIKGYIKKWVANNKEKLNATHRIYYAKNRERLIEYQRRRYLLKKAAH